MGEIIDKLKDKVKDAKDAVVDTTKDVAGKTKDTVDPSSDRSDQSYSSSSSGSGSDRKYEEGGPGTDVSRNDDPLTEYRDKEPMTPAKINAGEPTAVKRDPSDQTITSAGQTGTDTPEAQEEYRKRGMTKVDSHDHHSHEGSSCSCGGH
jgi:hypothetical protein